MCYVAIFSEVFELHAGLLAAEACGMLYSDLYNTGKYGKWPGGLIIGGANYSVYSVKRRALL